MAGFYVARSRKAPPFLWLDLQAPSTPLDVCAENAKQQMAKGMPLNAVLQQEWKLQAHAYFGFSAAADDKWNNKNGNHKITQVAVGEKEFVYPVQVTCAKM